MHHRRGEREGEGEGEDGKEQGDHKIRRHLLVLLLACAVQDVSSPARCHLAADESSQSSVPEMLISPFTQAGALQRRVLPC